MKFLDHCPADATADLVYRACPMHLLEPMELMKDLMHCSNLGAEALTPAIQNYQDKQH